MHLVAEVLDEQLKDSHDVNAGRIDGIVLELREGRPPRVAFVEVSPITLIARFSERLARWYARYDGRLGVGRGQPFRIAWSRIRRDGENMKMDMDADDTPLNALDKWLGRVIVKHIPGG